MNPNYLIPLSQVGAYTSEKDSITFQVDKELFKIDFLTEEIIRLKISQGGSFTEKPSAASIKESWPGTVFSISEEVDNYTIKTSHLQIVINKNNFAVLIKRLADDSILLQKHPDKPFYQYQNNHFVINRHVLPHEHIYGLGEKTGYLDRHGRSYRMWNKDVLAPDPDKKIEQLLAEKENDPLSTDFDPYYMSIPFYYRMHPEKLTAAGYFLDNPYPSTYNFDNQKNHSHLEIHHEGGQYCEYIFAQQDIKSILQAYASLTGTIERPPLWSLGYHQCRWKKYNSLELLELAKKQRLSDVPCDVLWLDIDYMDGYRVFTWNDELFPNKEALFTKLKNMGFRVITIVDPGIKYEPGYSIFDEAQKNDLLCKCENGQIYIGQVWPGKTAFPDFSKEACRNWWGKLNADHVASGIAGIWNDMNEPATGEISCQEMLFAGDNQQPQPHDRYHNEYALLMAMATHEGLKKYNPNERPFILSRAGSPGIQRYAANWLGDNASRWEHLQMSLPMMMGLSLSGQPFCGADIGGFVEATHPELFIRWVQCGVFYPFCRNHNDHPADQYVWSFGDSVTDICRQYIELRYKLLPYIYSCFAESSLNGTPVVKPLVYSYQNDPAVRQIHDQFLLGDAILVAPVLQAGKTTRTLYLPEGEWYDVNNEQKLRGKQWISVSSKINEIPWFIKSGHVIPMLKTAPKSTMELMEDSLVLLIDIPERTGTYTSKLFEDDGVSKNYLENSFLNTEFIIEVKENEIQISSETEGSSFAEFKRQRLYFQLKSAERKSLYENKKSLSKQKGFFELKNCGENFKVILR